MSNIPLKCIIGIVLSTLILSACNVSAKKEEPLKGNQAKPALAETMKMPFDAAGIDSMNVLFSGNEKKKTVSDTDKAKLGQALALSVNDTLWNNSGAVMKMAAPDYTVIAYYKGKPQDENSWIPVWKGSGKIMYKDKWYLLDESQKDGIYQILDNYK